MRSAKKSAKRSEICPEASDHIVRRSESRSQRLDKSNDSPEVRDQGSDQNLEVSQEFIIPPNVFGSFKNSWSVQRSEVRREVMGSTKRSQRSAKTI